MRIEKRAGTQERRILIGMIVDRSVLGAIAAKWDGKLFGSRWSNLVGGWCVDFFRRYGKPPAKAIESIFDQWSGEARRDKETIQLIESFLTSLSQQYNREAKSINSRHIVDIAGAYFNRVQLARLKDEIEADIEEGKIDKAEERVRKFNKLEIGVGAGVNVLVDKEAIRRAFAERADPLIVYKGSLGTFFGSALERDGFIAFEGPEKRGKTFMLLDVAFRAMLQGRKVAFFEVGDMSEAQIMRRLMVRVAKRPLAAGKILYPVQIDPPTGDARNQSADVDHEERQFKLPLPWKTAWRKCERLQKKLGREPLLKLSTHPNNSINVHGLRSILEVWDRQGWTPDVVVVDYADLLAPPVGVLETRDQINTTWKGLRALSQSLHCLVVTATQTDARSYSSDLITMSHFSEDKRKHAHVTGMIGLNANATEKHRGVLRLNWVVLRESEFSSAKCCHVAGCLAIGNPCICSTF